MLYDKINKIMLLNICMEIMRQLPPFLRTFFENTIGNNYSFNTLSE